MAQQIERRNADEIRKEYHACLRLIATQRRNLTTDEYEQAQRRREELKAELDAATEANTNTYKPDENKSQQQNQPATLKRGEGGKMNGAAATLVRQEAAEGGEIDALKQPEADSAGNPTAQALAAYPKRSALVEYEGNQLKEEEPALKRRGLTPRVLGTNARSKGTNPRARGENPRNKRSLTDFFKEKP